MRKYRLAMRVIWVVNNTVSEKVEIHGTDFCTKDQLTVKKRPGHVFIDLKITYDSRPRCDVQGRLVEAVKNFREDIGSYMTTKREDSELFGVQVGLKFGCVMPSWWFNL